MRESIEQFLASFSDFIWGMPMLILLLGGGGFFLIYSRFLPFQYLGHAIQILRGKYDDPNDPGDISHFEALSSALASTVGMGNISGVALAIVAGGPGALFWMWMSAFLGVATKFFTCTLAIMYRGEDTEGEVQGGPMYVVMEGLGRDWKPLAMLFAVAGLFGCVPAFQANQLTQVLRDVILIPTGIVDGAAYQLTAQAGDFATSDVITGVVCAILVGIVVFGGIQRIGNVAGKVVPFMVVLYILAVLFIILNNIDKVLPSFALIFEDAFTAHAVLGGALGAIILEGAQRAAFSNEAGMGTAPMAHGAAKTQEPVREGLVAMLGPMIDTLIICTMTGLAILITGVWQSGGSNGISMTAQAFGQEIPYGSYLLAGCAIIFAITTMFTSGYYGAKCLSFVVGAKYKHLYNYFYVLAIVFGASISVTSAYNLINGSLALMAVPTMISAILLAPKVIEASKVYFQNLKKRNY